MNDPSDQPAFEARTGRAALSPRELEVLGRRGRIRERRREIALYAGMACVAGLVADMLIGFAAWGWSGTPPFFGHLPWPDLRGLQFGVVIGCSLGALLLLAGRRKLMPFLPLPALAAAGLAGSAHYLAEAEAPGRVESATFFIRSLHLRSSRGLPFFKHEFLASASLMDGRGRHEKLYGRHAYIAQLAGQDCLTLRIRNTGAYRFPIGRPTLVETPHRDAVMGERDPARCFAGSATPSR